MRGSQILILAIAIIAIGLFILPSTLSMFVGQHTWFSVKNPGDMEDLCAKCHQPEVDEWNLNIERGGAHATFDTNYEDTSGCTICHQINETILEDYNLYNIDSLYGYEFEDFTQFGFDNTTNSSDFRWRNQSTPHAAIKVDCADCHYNATIQLMNNDSAHKDFYEQSTANATNSASCIGCHTMTDMDISWLKFGGLNINATINRSTNLWEINVTTNETLVQE